MNTPVNLREAVSNLNSLPAIPKVAQEILSLKLVTEEGEKTLLKLIEQDPLLSAKIVGLSNAPLFGSSIRVMTVRDAVTVLGVKRIKMIALSFAMMSTMAHRTEGSLDIQGLWRHSLAVAMAMHDISRAMPRDIRPQDDEIFLAGLLHDIGFMALNHISPQLSDKLHARLAEDKERSLEEIESELLDMNHCELGAELGRYWNLPDAIIAVLRFHHKPDGTKTGQHLVRLAGLAEKLLPTFGINEHVLPGVNDEEWQALGISAEKAEELLDSVQDHEQHAGEALA